MKFKLNNLLLIMLSIVTLISVTACQTNSEEKIKDVSVENLSETILNTEELEYGSLFPGSEEFLTETTGLDFSKIDSYSLSDPVSVQANILYIAKVKEKEDIEEVKKAFEARLETVQKSFEQYLIDQYELSLTGKVVTKGNYVMLTICKDTEKAVEIFNNELTDK